jgi:hypothetical protein
MRVLALEPLSAHYVLIEYKHIGAISFNSLHESHLQSVNLSARS